MKSNYVLYYTRLNGYFVNKRVGTKKEAASLDHFVGFFERECDAWKAACERQEGRIASMNLQLNHYRRMMKAEAKS